MLTLLKLKLRRFIKQSLWLMKIYYFLFNPNISNISGTGNIIKYDGAILHSVTFNIKGNNNKIEIMPGCRMFGIRISVTGDNHTITIGKGSQLGPDACFWLEDSNCLLEIGENTQFSDIKILLSEPGSKLTIGNDTMAGRGCYILVSDGHPIICKETGKCINYAEDIHIGNHVWLGICCIILKGTHISDDSIVASGSIVSSKFNKESVIIGGNPVKVLKENITWVKDRDIHVNKCLSFEK